MLLARMQRYVMAHLQDPELGPEQIARAHYVSTRYVHKLFAASGAGVSPGSANSGSKARQESYESRRRHPLRLLQHGGAISTLPASAGRSEKSTVVRRGM